MPDTIAELLEGLDLEVPVHLVDGSVIELRGAFTETGREGMLA